MATHRVSATFEINGLTAAQVLEIAQQMAEAVRNELTISSEHLPLDGSSTKLVGVSIEWDEE